MATKKAAGSTSLGRDSQSKRLGVKIYDGDIAKAGNIIVRQRGTKIRPGENVKKGTDDTLYAKITGKVKFATKKVKKFTGHMATVKYVHVLPQA